MSEVPGKARGTILIVDDDEQFREVTTRALEGAGYRCLEVNSVVGARALIRDEEIDLLVCEVNLPVESGLELIADLDSHDVGIGFVMVSGEDSADIAAVATERGAYGYLVKPFSSNQLLIAIANALHHFRLEKETLKYGQHLEALVKRRTKELAGLVEELHNSRDERLS
ncbi:MAG: cyclic di-GMP phosphodiesterase [Solirubrobacterales bacterium]|jgi:putative two-component system response regulator|nr:cyclic di-GMP phosphodiesterase [Solirubrobacterales bacterium]MDX6653258.1 cyclic di-GMP phosphodiesterase [Solirubrobacterales bacterium]